MISLKNVFGIGWVSEVFLKVTTLLLVSCSSALGNTDSGNAPARFVFDADARGTISLTKGFSADSTSEKVAYEMAKILGEITSRAVPVKEGDATGIVLAIASDYPDIAKEAGLDAKNALGREDYLIRSFENRLLLIGTTVAGTRMALADVLHRWGYRQFFVGKSWEVIPRQNTLSLQLDEVQRPAFYFRDIFTVNYLPGEEAAFMRWRWMNRLGSGFTLNTRHEYAAIYQRNAEVFAANPAYAASVDGKRESGVTQKNFKFNAASPGLLQLLVSDGKARLEADPSADSISMEPSDFGGWDNTGEAYATIGSASNQAVTMANIVAKEAAAPLGKYVGMYAYYNHQYPPDIAVEPNVIVSFATRFLSPDRDLYESISAWRDKGVKVVGIREYHSFTGWDLALPGRALGGNLHYLQKSIRRFHELGARLYTSEAQSAWGPYGLGYYITSCLLWDPKADVDAITTDFLEKCFGPAAKPMARFYSFMNGEDSVLLRYLTPDQLYGPLVEAWDAAGSREDVKQRIAELIAYVRYVELMGKMEQAKEDLKPELLKEIYNWVFQAESLQMLPTKALTMRNRQALRGNYYTRYLNPSESEITEIRVGAGSISAETLIQIARLGALRKMQEDRSFPIAYEKPLSSPWMRNSACFVFPLTDNKQVEVRISMRRFGFSEYPRYIVQNHEGLIVQRGLIRGDKDIVRIKSTNPGNYALFIEQTPNLVKCEANQGFFLEPTRDTSSLDIVRYKGSLYFNLPAGETGQVVVGGQGDSEKVDVRVLSENGQILGSEKNATGNRPLVVDFSVSQKSSGYQVRLRGPESGNFEDVFIKFTGGRSYPVGLTAGE